MICSTRIPSGPTITRTERQAISRPAGAAGFDSQDDGQLRAHGPVAGDPLGGHRVLPPTTSLPLMDPSYRRELPGRIVMTLGLFMSGCCIALIIVIESEAEPTGRHESAS